MTTAYPHGACGARTGPGTLEFCGAPLDELRDCPQLEQHWTPACPCGRVLSYYAPCPDCGMFRPL